MRLKLLRTLECQKESTKEAIEKEKDFIEELEATGKDITEQVKYSEELIDSLKDDLWNIDAEIDDIMMSIQEVENRREV